MPVPNAIVFIIGVALLVGAWRVKGDNRELVFHLLRDIGIACLVSVLLGYTFDFYQRARDRQRTIDATFDANMSDAITREVWVDVRNQILQKKLLRRDAGLRLKLKHENGLEPGQVLLEVELGYDLFSLSEQTQRATVRHELDYELAVPAKKLPRFESISVDDGRHQPDVYDGPRLDKMVTGGVALFPVDLEPRGNSHMHIVTKRYEVAHAPGSYNLYMTEYTKGLRINVDECPEDIEVEVKTHPEGNARNVTGIWYVDPLLLPGQGIEIRFKRRVVSPITGLRTPNPRRLVAGATAQ